MWWLRIEQHSYVPRTDTRCAMIVPEWAEGKYQVSLCRDQRNSTKYSHVFLVLKSFDLSATFATDDDFLFETVFPLVSILSFYYLSDWVFSTYSYT